MSRRSRSCSPSWSDAGATPVALAALVALAGPAACGRGGRVPADDLPPVTAEAWRTTWLHEAAFGDRVDERLVEAAAARWLGSPGADTLTWLPGAAGALPEGPGSRAFAERIGREDAQAVLELARTHHLAACALAADPAGLGPRLAEAVEVGARACETIPDRDRAVRARALAGPASDGAPRMPSPPPASTPLALTPAFSRRMELEGEALLYEFFLPGQLEGASRALAEGLGGPGSPAGAPPTSADPADAFVVSVGTSRWAAGPGSGPAGPRRADAASVLANAGRSGGGWTAIEAAAEGALAGLKGALTTFPGGKEGAPDPAQLGAVAAWARRALYRDLGFELAGQGDFASARTALEEALGAPGPAAFRRADPRLLATLARTAVEVGQPDRAVPLISTLASRPGWGAADPVSAAVARMSALPEAAEALVNR